MTEERDNPEVRATLHVPEWMKKPTTREWFRDVAIVSLVVWLGGIQQRTMDRQNDLTQSALERQGQAVTVALSDHQKIMNRLELAAVERRSIDASIKEISKAAAEHERHTQERVERTREIDAQTTKDLLEAIKGLTTELKEVIRDSNRNRGASALLNTPLGEPLPPLLEGTVK